MTDRSVGSEIPPSTKNDVKEFIRMDDGLKDARLETKAARKQLAEYRERIIQYMRETEITKLAIKKGTQILEIKEKTLKIRPRSEDIKTALEKLVLSKTPTAEEICATIKSCGGTKKERKLSRRGQRQTRKPKETPENP